MKGVGTLASRPAVFAVISLYDRSSTANLVRSGENEQYTRSMKKEHKRQAQDGDGQTATRTFEAADDGLAAAVAHQARLE